MAFAMNVIHVHPSARMTRITTPIHPSISETPCPNRHHNLPRHVIARFVVERAAAKANRYHHDHNCCCRHHVASAAAPVVRAETPATTP